ncbi:MAG: hypothetical protein ACODAF_10160 [Actinomycetota bacterium]
MHQSETGYRQQLRTVISATAAPYGYTLSVWSAGALASRAVNAFPSTLDTLLLIGGAVSGFALLAVLAFGGFGEAFRPTPRRQVRVWGGLHIPALGSSVLVCSGLVHVLRGHLIWLSVGFAATATYLAVLAGQYWFTSITGE